MTQQEVAPVYSSYTYSSPNLIKRTLHQNRYKNLLKGLKIDRNTRVLDIGAGDGRLFRIMIDEHSADPNKLIAFDPIPSIINQFNILVPEVQIFSDCKEIATPNTDSKFDYIFCCEVFEHLTDSQIEDVMAEFERLAAPDTIFVVEVPIELGPVGLMKNVYRRFNSGVDISFTLMIKALLGIKQERPSRFTAEGESFDHPGYSFRVTRQILSRIMIISSEFNDPFRHAPFVVNNSRIFIGKLRSK